jgi:hypothetical protein
MFHSPNGCEEVRGAAELLNSLFTGDFRSFDIRYKDELEEFVV